MAEAVLERRTYDAGEKIFNEGQTGNHAYIIQSGRVEIVKAMEDREIVLGTISENGIFGEMALIDDQLRMASARAAEVTTLIFVSRMMFEQKMTKTDPFVRGLLKILVGNIRSLSEELVRGPSILDELTKTAEITGAKVNPEDDAEKESGAV
jgi:CRP-like cAMP-binding protein